MRVTALGAYSMKGTAKKSGSSYDMAKLVIRVPMENVANANMTRMGYGFTTNELDMEVQALPKFNFQYPPEGVELDLIVGSELRFGRLQSVITGFQKVQAVKAVA